MAPTRTRRPTRATQKSSKHDQPKTAKASGGKRKKPTRRSTFKRNTRQRKAVVEDDDDTSTSSVVEDQEDDPEFVPTSSMEETEDQLLLTEDADASIETTEDTENTTITKTTVGMTMTTATTLQGPPILLDLASTVTPIEELTTATKLQGRTPPLGGVNVVVNRLYGANRPPTTITYDWIPKKKGITNITREHAKSQLAILGRSEATEKEVDDCIADMKLLLATTKEVSNYHVIAIIIGQAQTEKITICNRSVMTFHDVSTWWASLSEEEATFNAEKMFNIQQLMFESNLWAKDLEGEIMRIANITYHRPPQLPPNTKGCICTVIIQQRNCQTKNLTIKGKSTHGLYISVKPKDGTSMQRLRKHNGFGFKAWMLQKFEGKKRGVSNRLRTVWQWCPVVSTVMASLTLRFLLNKIVPPDSSPWCTSAN